MKKLAYFFLFQHPISNINMIYLQYRKQKKKNTSCSFIPVVSLKEVHTAFLSHMELNR